LYNTNFNIIPVVRGAPNVKELFPPNTFISTQDYKSPADLAISNALERSQNTKQFASFFSNEFKMQL
jgi:hypothetical protein